MIVVWIEDKEGRITSNCQQGQTTPTEDYKSISVELTFVLAPGRSICDVC